MTFPDGYLHRAAKATLLPQYTYSQVMLNRFFDAAHTEDQDIRRAQNIPRTIKTVDENELRLDNLEYFVKREKAMADDFIRELKNRISKKKAELFCTVIRNYWTDGYRFKNGSEVEQLLVSIRDYLLSFITTKKEPVQEPKPFTEPPSFNIIEIHKILNINGEMLYQYLHEWMEGHPEYLDMAFGDVFCRRGLYLPKMLPEGDDYFEYAYLNSYSLAASAPEKFAQIDEPVFPTIVSTRYENISNRILFFGPFIPEMPVFQLELGVIPSHKPQRLKYDDKHGDIYEFTLGY
jgi:hypothetical protein